MVIGLYLLPVLVLLVGPDMVGVERFSPMIAGFWLVLCWGIVAGWLSGIKRKNTQDREYMGSYVTEARYYEPWSEKVLVTERVQKVDADGKTYEEEESYWVEEYHPEESILYYACGAEEDVSAETYDKYVALFDNEEYTQVEHEEDERHRIVEDGGCYYTQWPGTVESLSLDYLENSYENRTLHTPNVYQITDLPEQTVKTYSLADYSKRCVYGNAKGDVIDTLEEKTDFFNCFSREHNVKLNFICLTESDISIAKLWQQHWKNGKRNTVNIVLGLKGGKIDWCYVFGWQNEQARVELRSLMMECKSLYAVILRFSDIEDILKNSYSLADFSKYNFVPVKYSLGDVAPVAITVLAIMLFALWFFGYDKTYAADIQRALRAQQWQRAESLLYKQLQNTPDYKMSNDLAAVQMKQNIYDKSVAYWLDKATSKKDQSYCVWQNKRLYADQTKTQNLFLDELVDSFNKHNSSSILCFMILEAEQVKNKKLLTQLHRIAKNEYKTPSSVLCKSIREDKEICIFGEGEDRVLRSRFWRSF